MAQFGMRRRFKRRADFNQGKRVPPHGRAGIIWEARLYNATDARRRGRLFPTTVASGGAQCGRTVYVDAFTWNATGSVALAGGSKDQGPCVHTHSTTGEKYPGVPPGPYLFVLTDCTRSGATPNAVVASSTDPAWWPGENRRIVPRFRGNLAVASTATPANTFPQVASAGTVSTVVRCVSTGSSTQITCVDMPITIVPGHQTLITQDDVNRCGTSNPCEAGTPTSPYQCNVESPENGAGQAAWAIDVQNQALLDGLNAMGFRLRLPSVTSRRFG